jgi:universal stress protein E
MTGRARHVLVAVTERGDAATMLPLAAAYAERIGAQFSVLLVREPVKDLSRVANAAGVTVKSLQNGLLAAWVTTYHELIDALPEAHRPRLEARIGTPFVEIIRYVVEHGVDIVLKAPDARGGLLGHVLTSTDQHLLRKCPGAVWLSDPAPRGLPSRVIVAVDIDDGTASEPETLIALNEEILAQALRIASRDGAELHLVHTWDAPGEALVRTLASTDEEGAARGYAADVAARHAQGFEVLLARLHELSADLPAESLKVHPHLVRGSVRKVIPELVRTLGAEALVMGTTARTSVPGLIIGNNAEDILNSVECGVLTVKPPSFESPITVA